MLRCLPLAAMLLLCAACGREPEPGTSVAETRRVAASEPPTVMAALDRLDEYAMLRRALALTGRGDGLRSRAPVTLLAPRDTAFVQLGPERLAAMMADPMRPVLTRAIDGLIVPRALRADELRQMIVAGGGTATLVTRAGPLSITSEGDLLIVTTPSGIRATMGSSEIVTGNGMIYVLDRWIAATP